MFQTQPESSEKKKKDMQLTGKCVNRSQQATSSDSACKCSEEKSEAVESPVESSEVKLQRVLLRRCCSPSPQVSSVQSFSII